MDTAVQLFTKGFKFLHEILSLIPSANFNH